MSTKIEQERTGGSSPALDRTAVAAQEEVLWARTQARRATWAILVPFVLLALASPLLAGDSYRWKAEAGK